MAIDEIAEYLHDEDMEEAMDDMLETIEQRHSERCDNITVVALAWDDPSPPGKSMQHEKIRDLKDNDLWRAAREAEKGIKGSKDVSAKVARATGAQPGGDITEDLASVISEVESFVKRWEEEN
jgi:hypothetical protein